MTRRLSFAAAALSVLVQGGPFVAGGVLSIVLARTIGPTGTGRFALLVTLTGLTAMVVSLAGISNDSEAEVEAQLLLAHARVAVLEAQTAVRRAAEAVAVSRAGRARALQLMSEARALRARDRSRTVLSAPRAEAPLAAPITALMRIPTRAS